MADDEFDIDFGDCDFILEEEDDQAEQTEEADEKVQQSKCYQKVDDDHTASTAEYEILQQPDPDEEMDDDDEFNDLISQMNESEIYQAYCSTASDANVQPTVSSPRYVMQSINPNSSVVLTSTSCNVHVMSPLKMELCTNTQQFFSSQQDYSYPPRTNQSFPGPAGLLPSYSTTEIKRKFGVPVPLQVNRTSKSRTIVFAEPLRIQSVGHRSKDLSKKGSDIQISNAPWTCLVKTLSLNLRDDGSVMQAMNINWVKSNASKFPLSVKIPFLVLVVKENLKAGSSSSTTMNSIRLMDHSGTIIATLDEQFIKAYGDQITPGTALALHNCRVIKHRYSVVLTVTKSNLVCLSTEKEFKSAHRGRDMTKEFPKYTVNEHGVHLLQMGPCMPDQMMQDYKRLMKMIDMKRDLDNNKNTDGDIVEITQPLESSILPTVNKDNETRVSSSIVDNQSTTFNVDSKQASFTADNSGIDDDDEEFLKALEGMDFEIDENQI